MTTLTKKHLKAKALHDEIVYLLQKKTTFRLLFALRLGELLYKLENKNTWRKVHGDNEGTFDEFVKYEYLEYGIRKDEMSRAKDVFKYFITHYQIPKEEIHSSQTRVIHRLISHFNKLVKHGKDLPDKITVTSLLQLPEREVKLLLNPHECNYEEYAVQRCKVCKAYKE